MHNTHKLLTSFFVASVILATSTTIAAQGKDSNSKEKKEYITRHTKQHLLLVDGSYLSTVKNNHKSLTHEISNKDFLSKKASESDNPLAPCSILANALISVNLSSVRHELVKYKKFQAPPRGMTFFRMYDDVIREEGFFGQPPEIQADILARKHIVWSGGFDMRLNSFIHKLKQKQCLDFLLIMEPQSVFKRFDEQSLIKTLLHRNLHYTAVAVHGSTYTSKELELYLNELKSPKFLTLSTTGTDNPLMPCNLFKAYVMSKYVNALWSNIYNGTLVLEQDNPILGQYFEKIKDGRIPTDDPVVAANITAGFFTDQSIYSDARITDHISNLSQHECLNQLLK